MCTCRSTGGDCFGDVLFDLESVGLDCHATGTLILLRTGEVPVDAIGPDDPVMTLDGAASADLDYRSPARTRLRVTRPVNLPGVTAGREVHRSQQMHQGIGLHKQP